MALDNEQFVLLEPEEAPQEIYPYRRVWRSMVVEIGAMLGMVALIFGGVLAGVLRDVKSQNWGLLLVLVPLATYLWYSVRGEQRAMQPREGLLTVTLFSALLANGVGVPLVEAVFRPEDWLADAGFFSRVLGYTFTVGVTSEFLKYIAIRYTIWPDSIRVRMDGIAYAVAAAIGYATVLNLHIVFGREATVTADAIRIAVNFIAQVSFSVVLGYFMAEVALTRRPAYFLPSGLLAGSMISGMYIAFRALAADSGFSVELYNALIMVLGFAISIVIGINFLIDNADNREYALRGEKRIR